MFHSSLKTYKVVAQAMTANMHVTRKQLIVQDNFQRAYSTLVQRRNFGATKLKCLFPHMFNFTLRVTSNLESRDYLK